MRAAATSTQLRLAGAPQRRRLPATAWSDISLLAFLLALHAMPLVALAAGRERHP